MSPDRPAVPPRGLADRLRRPSRWWFLPPVAIGLAALILSVVFAPGTPREEQDAAPLAVRYVEARVTDVAPTYTGHGRVRPRHTWQAVAQVPGSVSWRHPELQPGARLEAGEHLLTIDRDDYQDAVEQAESQVLGAEAALEELDARADDLERSLGIEREALEIAEADYTRNVALAEAGHISEVRLDNQQQALLRQRRTVQNLKGQIALLPAQRRAAEARLREGRAALARAERDLRRTQIVMPFDGRIDRVDVDQSQFVPLGQPMVRAESTGDMEVVLEASHELMMTRFPSIMGAQTPSSIGDQMPARVRKDGGQSWRGRVVRIDPGLSRQNRAAQVYVAVETTDDVPPPSANLYVEVEIEGPPLSDRVVIPRLAWRNGEVLIATSQDTLQRRQVEIDFVQQDSVVVREGLEAGERVIVTDVLYPADGMAIDPQPAQP